MTAYESDIMDVLEEIQERRPALIWKSRMNTESLGHSEEISHKKVPHKRLRGSHIFTSICIISHNLHLILHSSGTWYLWLLGVTSRIMSRNCERMQVSHISVKQYAANTIAQNMYSPQLDEDGYSSTALLESIVDYSKDGHAGHCCENLLRVHLWASLQATADGYPL